MIMGHLWEIDKQHHEAGADRGIIPDYPNSE